MMQSRWSCRFVVAALVCALLLAPCSAWAQARGVNPPDTSIRARLKDAALRYNIPSVILMAIAYQESGWRQFDASGNTVIGTNATSQDIGIMQINTANRTDVDRLMTDIDYNIETGAKILDGKWKLAPGIGDRDRNVLENWYFAVWAYNGLSSTNNPNTPGGRHYQDRVLGLMARQILGSDGQPLWPPVAVTLPDPAIITDPPTWIPTPQPVHYGDLYNGFNQGDNFRVLEGPAGAVLSTSTPTTVSFLVQNVGTTIWDASYQTVLAVGDPVVAVLPGQVVAGPVPPGGTTTATFTLPTSLPSGPLVLSMTMTRGSNAFGATWMSSCTMIDIAASAAIPDTILLGSTVAIPVSVSSSQSVMVTTGFELRNERGTLVDGSVAVASRYGGAASGIAVIQLPGQQTGEIRYFVARSPEGLLSPGIYSLSVTFAAGTSGTAGVGGTVPFAGVTRTVQLVAPGLPGLVIVDSSSPGAVVAVDGVVQPFQSPCALPTAPGPHVIVVTDAASLPFETTVDTAAAPVTLVTPTLVPIDDTGVTLAPSSSNLDFGVLKAGAGTTERLVLLTTGTMPAQGVVSTSANWIRVSPLIFDGSQSFTVGVDARWLDPGVGNSGTITFSAGTIRVTVQVRAGFAPMPAASFILSPQAVRTGEGDEFALDLTAQNGQLIFDRVDLTVAWDQQLLELVTFAPVAALLDAAAPAVIEPGILRITGTVTNLPAGENVLGSLRFRALAAADKTGVNLRGTATLAGTITRVTTGGSAVGIARRFVAPGTPGAFAAVGEQGQVRLTWSPAVTGSYPLLRYDLYRAKGTPDMQAAELVAEVKPSATQFIDRGPLERSVYSYWIMSEDTKGNVSAAAGPVRAQPIITSTTTKVTLVFTLGKASVAMNGVIIPMETPPVIENGRTILPVRYIATPLGAQVLWSSREQKVTLIGSRKIELWIGKPVALVDGVEIPIDPVNPLVAPRIVAGRTMLPLRFIAETFGADIIYDAILRTVTVTLTRTT